MQAHNFYPKDAKSLGKLFDEMSPRSTPSQAISCILPHAGLAYSGQVAMETLTSIEIPQEVLVLCFNHRGLGRQISLWPEGDWETPFGNVPISDRLISALKLIPEIELDPTAHMNEHSGEMQVLILKYLRHDVKIAVLSVNLWTQDKDLIILSNLGRKMANKLDNVLVVASSDLNHYESKSKTIEKDYLAIEQIKQLDETGFRKTIVTNNISICGYAPIVCWISYSKTKGAKSVQVVAHSTSADHSGDEKTVVGYAGIRCS